MEFLANINEESNHLTTITEKLKVSKQAYIAVAFLKTSGLNYLITPIKTFLKSGGQLFIVVGQNFALTEPNALSQLHKLFGTYTSSKLFLAKADYQDKVFHPKLYLFKQQKECCVISGSANLTKGGLIENKETSIIAICSDNDKIWIDAKNYFDTLTNHENSDEASLLVIKQYESYFEQQKQYNKSAKPIPTKSESQLAFNYFNLAKHLKGFDLTDREQEFNNKLQNYKRAKKILNQIADDSKLTQKQFEPLLDSLVGSKEYDNLWHSGSLFRLRRFVYPHFREFRDLVLFIREHKNKPADFVFENAKAKVKQIKGAAVNYVTEIMMTYNFNDFAKYEQKSNYCFET